MGGTQKAPPRILPPPPGRRVFAHILKIDLACPACGTLSAAPHAVPRTSLRQRPIPYGYDPTTCRFRCRGCERTYLIGALFWRVRSRRRSTRPADTVPTTPEALALRADLELTDRMHRSLLAEAPAEERRGQVNRLIADPDGDEEAE